jgi:hypothetical protein
VIRAIKPLTLDQAILVYHRDRKVILRALKDGRLPGYQIGTRWYTFPPEIAFKGVIEKYKTLAAEIPLFSKKEVAKVLQVPVGTLKRWIHEGRFQRGQMIEGIMFWDVMSLRKAVHLFESNTPTFTSSGKYCCLRCGHTWKGKSKKPHNTEKLWPRKCPKCQSLRWNRKQGAAIPVITYSETLMRYLKRELTNKPIHDADLMTTLRAILALPKLERDRELERLYAIAES